MSGLQSAAVFASALPAAAMLMGCSTYRSLPGDPIAQTKVGDTTVFDHASQTFATALKQSADHPDQAEPALKAFKAGRAMLDLQCDVYLDAVGRANQATSHERKQVNLIGGFASAIMGLTGSSAKQIAGVATSFSFASSSLDAFTTAYLFSDAAKSVIKIVRASQAAYLASAQAELGSLDYPGAVTLLVGYEAVCRPAQIRALIDEAVTKGEVVAEPVSAQVSDAEVLSVLTALGAQLGRPISEREAINLYAWFKYPADRNAGAKTAANEPVASFREQMGDAALERKLAQGFLSTSLPGSTIPARWSPAVRQILKPSATDSASVESAPLEAFPQPAPETKTTTPPRLIRVPVLTIR